MDWWRTSPPHVRQGSLGAILLVAGVLGYAGLLARVDAASPLAPIGQFLYAFAGWGAFPLMALLVADGGLRTAEGMARRALLPPYLIAVALALWLVGMAVSQLLFGGATGGVVGTELVAPLRHVPGITVWAVALALGAALTLALAGVGLREAGRGVAWTMRGGLRHAPWVTRPATVAMAGQTPTPPKRARRLAPSPASPSPAEPEEVPARLLLPTAGFPGLETGGVAWELPPLDLFDAPARATPSSGTYAEELARRLERALAALRLDAEVRREDISLGPAVIRLGIRPAERAPHAGQPATTRTPASHILRAQHELAVALGIRQVRMEAPTPGQPMIGVEVPRPGARPVSLYELLGDDFQRVAARSRLPVALGWDTRGSARALDLAATPHLLLAGDDGAEVIGGLHVALASLLCCATPEDARLMLLDPGRRALAAYDDMPHLLLPTITEAGAAISALHRLIEEAERRRELFTQLGLRDLAAYQHLAQREGELEWLPALVVAVAELGDLAPVGAEAERSLCRLAQAGRMVGIHLLLATGRPGPTLLTVALRARIPARLAFAVASAAESRAIVEAPGAECLAGQGDLLFLAGEAARLERIAGGAVSDEEVARLARFWRHQGVAGRAYGSSERSTPPVGNSIMPLSALDQPTIPSQAEAQAGAPPTGSPLSPPQGASWLPPLARRPRPSAPPALPTLAGGGDPFGGPAPQVGQEEGWRPPLPAGWTDEMLEDMMQQIRAVIAQGRAPRPPRSPGYPMEEE
jgi:DNA segregation ATPase FtsK/SpoIIIE-like protein